ncbi:MAG: polysaccharide deacetylase family protein [Hydrogenophilales bacterium]|nr:polysaccharide deacetylase family protein [Hydrogenophilales bacterium]
MTRIDPLSRALHRQAGQHGPIMLMYHAVTPGKDAPVWPWAVSMRRFRDQLDFLATEGYATPTMGELAATPAKAWPGRTAVITFDDGYADNLAACEELQKRGMRATWFIVSGSIGQAPRWPEDGRPAGRLLNAGELREMQANGMEIGSHTVSHVRLTGLDDAHLMQELTHSRTTLEDLLGNAVGSFAYPYGDWDARCAAAVQQAGYAAACTTRTGWALRDKTPYQLRRLTVFNTDTPGSFARKLYFGSHDVRWRDIARYALRRIQGI